VKRHKWHATANFQTTCGTGGVRQWIAGNWFAKFGTINHREFFSNQAGGGDTPAVLASQRSLDLTGELAGVTQPAIVVHGRYDRACGTRWVRCARQR
jgi:hypothetical protein